MVCALAADSDAQHARSDIHARRWHAQASNVNWSLHPTCWCYRRTTPYHPLPAVARLTGMIGMSMTNTSPIASPTGTNVRSCRGRTQQCCCCPLYPTSSFSSPTHPRGLCLPPSRLWRYAVPHREQLEGVDVHVLLGRAETCMYY
jgi:hypothetical protein